MTPDPPFPVRFLIRSCAGRAWPAIACVLLAAGCAQQPVAQSPGAAAPGQLEDAAAAQTKVAPAKPTPGPELPKQDLTDQTLYEYLLAEIANQRGNAAVSAQAYVDLAQRTRDPRIARRATEIAIYARMPETALTAAQIWLETDPQSPEALRTVTSLLVSVKRLPEAEPYLQRVLAASAESRGNSFLQLNRLLAGSEDKRAILELVQRLAAPYPALAQAHFAIAQAAAAAGEEDLALKEIREAGRLEPDWELAALYEAQLLQKRSNAEAAARLAAFLEGHPNSRDVRLNYARLLVNQKSYPEARAEFQKLLETFPDNTEVMFAVAVLSMQLEDYAAAEDYLKRLLALDYRDRNTVYFYLGQLAEEQKRFPEARGWYREVTRGEHYLPAQIRQAEILSKQGDLAGAREFLHKVDAANNQQRVQLILAEAQLLREANQTGEAFKVVGRGLEKLPDNTDLLYDYAMLAEKLDRMDILESSLRKVIRIKPDHAHAYNALGYSLADRSERLAEAREYIETALKLAPDDAFIIDSMGWVLYREGKPDEALKYLERAYAGRPDPEIAAHLGEVLWTVGQHAEAEKVWNDALTKAPTNDTLIKTIKRLKP
ncbi:MAG: tetratricopeptide repeat protein [Burkholderiales bacterium]|nr:tetratricopeptide repeat protein [Burkholderiales bacterium]